MKVIGLTGGIGSGKSAVSAILKKYGARVVDADAISHKIMQKGEAAYYEIVDAFGTCILDDNENINRGRLGNIVFSDRELLDKLTHISHTHIIATMENEIEEYRKSGFKGLVAIDAPLPVKRGFLDLVDEVWVVTAKKETRIKRVISRSGLSAEQAEKRIQAQMSEEEYLKLADVVIENNGTIEELEEKVADIIRNSGY